MSCDAHIRMNDSCSRYLFVWTFSLVQVHGEMYELTRNLALMESKMFKPIMDQLDSAFVLNKDSSRSGGGFVDIQ